MKKRLKVLLLGGTGRIGPGFLEEYLEHYKNHYEIILGIHKKADRRFKNTKVNIFEISSLKKAMKGIDVVVHLAANANAKAKFDELLKPNIIGTYNVFQAAKEAKVKRIIFASSIHAVEGYPHTHEVTNKETPRPIDLYGASKAFGEALCSVYSRNNGMSCFAIRIGAYTSNDNKKVVCIDRKDYGHIISQRDFAQLVHRCIIAPGKIKYGILSGISNDKHKHLGLRFTKKLVGYKPKDDAYIMCAEIKRHKKM